MAMPTPQEAYYRKEWEELNLSSAPSKSGWRTSVAAPDFIAFVNDLALRGITGRALDIGCGAGRHSIVFAKNGFETYGIDFAPAAIELAIANAKNASVDIGTNFTVGDALELPYEDSFFDVINDDGCLHHINPEDWKKYSRGIFRVLKPEGVFRVKVFSRNCNYFQKNADDQKKQWVLLKDSGYTYFFTKSEIQDIFSGELKLISVEEKVHPQTADKKFYFGIFQKA